MAYRAGALGVRRKNTDSFAGESPRTFHFGLSRSTRQVNIPEWREGKSRPQRLPRARRQR
jgi:hypothetical protein